MGGRHSRHHHSRPNPEDSIARALQAQARATALASEIQKEAAPPKPKFVTPPLGNWNEYVKRATSSHPEGIYKFYVGKSGGGTTDPVFGCPKEFSSTYTCGLEKNIRTVEVPAEAGGQAATYDCGNLTDECNGYKLTLGDDGNLILTNDKGGTLWESNTKKTGVPSEKYKAINSKYKRNYLMAGETLKTGEFIGSPSGNCYLIMTQMQDCDEGVDCGSACEDLYGKTKEEWISIIQNNMNSGKAWYTSLPGTWWYGKGGEEVIGLLKKCSTTYGALQIQYRIQNCSLDGENHYGNDSNSVALYTIPKSDLSNIGKVGYVEPDLTLRTYPTSLVKLGSKFYKIGGFSNDGGDIKELKNSSVSECETACVSDNNCRGFTFDNSNKTCTIKGSNMYPKTARIPSKTTTLYMRGSEVNGSDTCPSNTSGVDGNMWKNSLLGNPMSATTKCNLTRDIQKQYKQMITDNKNLETQANNIVKNLSTLTQKDYNLGNNLDQSLKKMRKDLDDYNQQMMDKQTYEERRENVHAMAEDTELRMVSNNYTFLLWSILAIIILLGAIRHVRR